MNSQDTHRQIDLYIHCPGGSVYAGLAIFDAMQMITAPVSTVAVGFSGSMGTALLTSGVKGKRFSLAHSTIHLHPAGGGAKGYTEDVRIATREQERLQTQLFHLIGNKTGHTWQELEAFFIRDKYLNAMEGKDYGMVDGVIGDTYDLIRLVNHDREVTMAN
ncbi:MAG: ClpP family protease [Candidatus Cyclobacteriaceae bacterium M3_2C_046]